MEERVTAIELISEAVASGARRDKACKIVGITLRTLQRWESDRGKDGDKRRGPNGEPANALSEAEQALIIAVAGSKMFRDLPPSQIVPILADAGVYLASESTFYRILRETNLLAHRGRAKHRSMHRPKEYAATGPNQVWSWDISYLKSPLRGEFFYLYLVVDIWSRKIVGWAVHELEDSGLAASLIREAAFKENVAPEQLVLHSDNGGPMKGATMVATLQWLGIIPSFSRPRVSDDNPYSESLFKTLKYRPEYPNTPFEDLSAARTWVENFVGWYNTEHRHSGIQFVTPAQRHSGDDIAILEHRKEVYRQAKKMNQNRWSREIRNWEPTGEVILNPVKKKDTSISVEKKTA